MGVFNAPTSAQRGQRTPPCKTRYHRVAFFSNRIHQHRPPCRRCRCASAEFDLARCGPADGGVAARGPGPARGRRRGRGGAVPGRSCGAARRPRPSPGRAQRPRRPVHKLSPVWARSASRCRGFMTAGRRGRRSGSRRRCYRRICAKRRRSNNSSRTCTPGVRAPAISPRRFRLCWVRPAPACLLRR